MARRVLRPRPSGQLYPSLLLVLSLASCKHEERAPTPSGSASALGSDFTAQARERHFQEELGRARTRNGRQQSLADCAKASKEKADLELCQAAQSALSALTAEPAATAELALARLAPAALALARLSQRMRYLSLAELAQRRVEADAGAAPAGSAATAAASGPPPLPRLPKGKHALHAHAEQQALELDGPVAQLLAVSIRLEHDVIRNLGAYLEYGPLLVRRAAFDTAKRMRAEHPEWPALDHLLQEAAVLESDPDLRRDLRQLSPSSAALGAPPGQSAGTK